MATTAADRTLGTVVKSLPVNSATKVPVISLGVLCTIYT